jgi:hypothetical protein
MCIMHIFSSCWRAFRGTQICCCLAKHFFIFLFQVQSHLHKYVHVNKGHSLSFDMDFLSEAVACLGLNLNRGVCFVFVSHLGP